MAILSTLYLLFGNAGVVQRSEKTSGKHSDPGRGRGGNGGFGWVKRMMLKQIGLIGTEVTSSSYGLSISSKARFQVSLKRSKGFEGRSGMGYLRNPF